MPPALSEPLTAAARRDTLLPISVPPATTAVGTSTTPLPLLPGGESALQFAARTGCSQLRAFAGDVLYTAGMPAAHFYVVKDGEVDLYLLRDEKRTVVETLRPGQCFGIEPHQQVPVRLHNAAARTYCELYIVEQATAREAIAASPDLTRGLMETLSDRLAVAHEVIARRANFQPDLLIYANLLALLGMADLGRQAQQPRGRDAAGEAGLARPLVQDVFTHARLMFGHSDKHIRAMLAKLVGLHLVRIDDERGTGKQVLFAPKDLLARARQAAATDPDQDKLRYEYIGVDEFAALVDAERGQILRKLAASEYADDVFTFRRAEILRLLNEKGKRFFVERRLKPPAEFSELADLEFADAKSIFAAVSKVDGFALAQAMTALDEGSVVKAKILGCLSQRRRNELEEELQGLGAVDPVQAQQIGQQIVNEVKTLMLSRAG